jgi:hypothetical protein
MKGDRRKPSQADMRRETRKLLESMSDQELAEVALMNKQNLELDPDLRISIAAELREEIARRKGAQQEREECRKPPIAM